MKFGNSKLIQNLEQPQYSIILSLLSRHLLILTPMLCHCNDSPTICAFHVFPLILSLPINSVFIQSSNSRERGIDWSRLDDQMIHHHNPGSAELSYQTSSGWLLARKMSQNGEAPIYKEPLRIASGTADITSIEKCGQPSTLYNLLSRRKAAFFYLHFPGIQGK